ncbi:MAG: transglutaminase TgpA family protein, partial [Candidatus Binatia bacterium]
QARRLATESFVDPSLFRGVASVTFVLFVSTITVFVFFPRMGAGLFANPLATGAGLTGFSDEIGLGDVTALKSDETVAMRVSIDRPERIRGAQYWRGSALDSFDGRRWTRARQELRPLTRALPGLFVAREGADPKTLVRQDVILEPLENPTLFFLGSPLQVRGRFSGMMVNGVGDLRVVPSTTARIRYDVLSSLAPRTELPTPRSRKTPKLDPRVATLSRRLVEGISGETARAEALLRHFRRGFRYTMNPGTPATGDPLAWFLFETRTGHCEYFASSLAVMLRVVGIPSLVVNGYVGGEWNSYGEYFVVRQSDAHSWVEAHVDGRWRLLDPTPASGQAARSTFDELRALIDSYRMRWYRYVVNYSLEDQIGIAFSIRNSSRRLWGGFSGDFWRDAWRRLRGSPSRRGASPVMMPLAALSIAVLVSWLWHRRRKRREAQRAVWATTRYLALLRVLERRGLKKRPADTADEFYHRIGPELDADRELVERLTALYQDARFSGDDGPEKRSQIEALLGDLERRG